MPTNDCRAPLARRTNGCAICPPEALRAAKRTTGINILYPPRSKPTRQDHLNAPRRNPLDFPFQPLNPHHRVTHSVARSGSYLNWKILYRVRDSHAWAARSAQRQASERRRQALPRIVPLTALHRPCRKPPLPESFGTPARYLAPTAPPESVSSVTSPANQSLPALP